MAIGDPYATYAELKDYLKLTDAGTTYDARLTDAVNTASREIERLCNRQFNKETSATSRLYIPGLGNTDKTYALQMLKRCNVDDFWTTVGLIIETDASGDGTFETVWSASDFEEWPLNGIVDGQPGWPYWKLRATGGKYFPVNYWGRRSTVRVTAQWGWPAVPAPVKQACLIMAAETYELKSAPLGVAGFGEFGVVRVRVNPMAASKLQRYKRDPILVG